MDSWRIPRLERFSRLAPKIEVILADKSCEAVGADADVVFEWGAVASMADVEVERLTHERAFPCASLMCVPDVWLNATLAGATLVHRHGFPGRYDFPN